MSLQSAELVLMASSIYCTFLEIRNRYMCQHNMMFYWNSNSNLETPKPPTALCVKNVNKPHDPACVVRCVSVISAHCRLPTSGNKIGIRVGIDSVPRLRIRKVRICNLPRLPRAFHPLPSLGLFFQEDCGYVVAFVRWLMYCSTLLYIYSPFPHQLKPSEIGR